jgi:1-aminocyclopropane-1-carboxylate deaminase/D-cysteine desulfhydrase-like pyridoxal-dependent ACC family enzyme
MTDLTEKAATLNKLLAKFPRTNLGHYPTPIEPMSNLGAALGIDLAVKRDDCTGVGFGGNKVRQLEFYLGKAQAQRADTVLITGAVQSNFVRTAAAMARRLGMDCHIQLEERVAAKSPQYRENGNVLLDKLLGATLLSYPDGEDEAGADAALTEHAKALRDAGKRPFIVPLSPDSPPLGALGYIAAALELAQQIADGATPPDRIFIGTGSALSHVGLLYGLRALGIEIPVVGVCVRRDAEAQSVRVSKRVDELAAMIGTDCLVCDADIEVDASALEPGYGLRATGHACKRGDQVGRHVRRTISRSGLYSQDYGRLD